MILFFWLVGWFEMKSRPQRMRTLMIDDYSSGDKELWDTDKAKRAVLLDYGLNYRRF